MTQLSDKDKKILAELEHNSRQSFSEIAKRLKTSKEVINYRVKNLLKEGIIIRFFTEINLAKLGMQVYKICFQFQNVNFKKEEEMYNYFIHELKIPWIISCSGKYDMIMSFGAHDINDFDHYLTRIMNKFSDYILNKEISTTLFFMTFDRRWINNEKEISHTTVGGDIEKNLLDNKDREILVGLSNHSRIQIIELANKLNLTSGAVINRIKSLEKKGVINRYRLGLSYKKLGKEFCKAFVYLTNKTSEEEKKLINYVESLPQIFTIIKCVGSWDLEFEFLVDNFPEFHDIMRQIKNRFNIVRGYESVIISKEYGINYFNFI